MLFESKFLLFLQIGWDPVHFNELLRSSTHSNEICLLVKKMPRHNDDEVYTKRLADGPQNPRRSRARGVLERKKQQAQDNRNRLLEQEGYGNDSFFLFSFFFVNHRSIQEEEQVDKNFSVLFCLHVVLSIEKKKIKSSCIILLFVFSYELLGRLKLKVMMKVYI
jgi:hypothetical protein